MEINLSWDLFVIVFFTVIIAYSFIIGRNQTLKIIIASYIAILTADAVGNLVNRYLVGDRSVTDTIEIPDTDENLVVIKIFIFISTIVLIAVRGRFTINVEKTTSPIINMILSFVYGILSAGLITSTILIYTSGSSLVEASGVINATVTSMYLDSKMVQAMINNYNMWFSLPAIVFVVSSFIGEDAVEEE